MRLCYLTCVFITTLLLFSANDAYAYLDPATGSMMIQIAIGGIVGALAILKIYFARIKAFIQSLFAKKSDES